MAHSYDFPIKWGKGSRARWSESPDGSVLVFVHGYGGSPRTTFSDFDVLLPQITAAERSDLVFYGYPSRSNRVGGLADDFLAFLDALGAKAVDAVINPTAQTGWRRDPSFQFKRIVIVAHSLGAVIVRRALLDAADSHPSWIASVKMVLYAPAHLGALALQLAGDSFLSRLVPVAQLLSRSLNDLKEDSGFIKQLKDDTVKALSVATSKNHLIAALVVHAHKDIIVDAGVRFCGDPKCKWVEQRRTHITVCKPKSKIEKPFKLLCEVL